ncbi:proteasome activator [Pedococcus sp. 2YAF34]|uniref:bacterial proteasome activator family protein n=1 Tax=Pedococcus sp. 2YAF34 TaxID=3233032 RepID=UPI003F99F0E8
MARFPTRYAVPGPELSAHGPEASAPSPTQPQTFGPWPASPPRTAYPPRAFGPMPQIPPPQGARYPTVEQPAKVMRIGSMIKQLLEEVRNAPLDEAGRARLAEIHRRSIKELEDGLAPELIEELERIALPFEEGHAPTDAELRIAQAQLVGWLEGLFHGIQTALFAQQMAAQQQLAQMRRALPPGHPEQPGPGVPGVRPDLGEGGPTGQYL